MTRPNRITAPTPALSLAAIIKLLESERLAVNNRKVESIFLQGAFVTRNGD
jgi:hypothetical protein